MAEAEGSSGGSTTRRHTGFKTIGAGPVQRDLGQHHANQHLRRINIELLKQLADPLRVSRRGRHQNGVGLFVTFDGDLPLQQSGRRTQLFVRQCAHQLTLFLFHKVGHNRGDFGGLGIPQLNREGLTFVGFQ